VCYCKSVKEQYIWKQKISESEFVNKSISTDLFTRSSKTRLEKLTSSQIVKKFPAFYGTRKFITAFTSASHLYQSWVCSIQSRHPYPTSWRSILILSSHLCLGLPSDFFLSGLPTKPLYTPLLTHTCYLSSQFHSSRFVHSNNIEWDVQIIKLLIMWFPARLCKISSHKNRKVASTACLYVYQSNLNARLQNSSTYYKHADPILKFFFAKQNCSLIFHVWSTCATYSNYCDVTRRVM